MKITYTTNEGYTVEFSSMRKFKMFRRAEREIVGWDLVEGEKVPYSNSFFPGIVDAVYLKTAFAVKMFKKRLLDSDFSPHGINTPGIYVVHNSVWKHIDGVIEEYYDQAEKLRTAKVMITME